MFSEVMNEITVEDQSTGAGVVFVVTFRSSSVTAEGRNIRLFAQDIDSLKALCRAQQVSKIIFDFSRISDWDNAAMKVLAAFRAAFQGTSGSDVRVCCVGPQVEAIFLWKTWKKRIVRYSTQDHALSTPWNRRSPYQGLNSKGPTDKHAA